MNLDTWIAWLLRALLFAVLVVSVEVLYLWWTLTYGSPY